MAESPGLRALKKERTRDLLVEEALALFQRKGFEGATVDEIALAAGVSRRTFFRYFPTKEAVVFPDREARLARFRANLARREPGETPFARVRRACADMARVFARQRGRIVAQQRVIEASPALIAQDHMLDRDWEEAITETFLDGRTGAASRRRARLLAGAVLGAIRSALRSWIDDEGRSDLEELGNEAFDVLEQGAGAALRRSTARPRTSDRREEKR